MLILALGSYMTKKREKNDSTRKTPKKLTKIEYVPTLSLIFGWAVIIVGSTIKSRSWKPKTNKNRYRKNTNISCKMKPYSSKKVSQFSIKLLSSIPSLPVDVDYINLVAYIDIGYISLNLVSYTVQSVIMCRGLRGQSLTNS